MVFLLHYRVWSCSPHVALNGHRRRGALFATGVLVSYQRDEALAPDRLHHAHEELPHLPLLGLQSEESSFS